MKGLIISSLLLLSPYAAKALDVQPPQPAPASTAAPAAVETSSEAVPAPAAKPQKVPAYKRADVYRFVYDTSGRRSMESGVSQVWNASRLLYRGTNYLADKTGLHNHWYSRPLFLPVMMLAFPSPKQFLHEYYGHGSVLREFGYHDVSYRWGWFNSQSKDGLASSMRIQAQGTYEEKQLWLGGGLAASQLFLLEAEKDMYRKGRITLLMLLPVQAAMNDLSYMKDGMDAGRLNGRNDSASWLNNYKALPGNTLALTTDLSNKSAAALDKAVLNPVLPWLVAAWLHYFWTGDDSLSAPMLPVAGLKLGFSPKVNLTPLGPENYFYLFIARKGRLASLYYRAGDSTAGSVKGYGAEFGPIKLAEIALTPGYDQWTLPKMQNTALKYAGSGYNAQLKLDAPLYKALGLTGKAAYKTGGYLLGLPAHSGLYGYAGVSLSF